MAIVDIHGSILHANKQFKLQFANCKPLQGRSIEEFIASDSESQSGLIAKVAKIASDQSKWETSVITESRQKVNVVLSNQALWL